MRKAGEIKWPCELSTHFKGLLLSAAQPQVLATDQELVLGKNGLNGLYYVVDGPVYISTYSTSKTCPFMIIQPRDWFGSTLVYKIPDFSYKLGTFDVSRILFIPDQFIRDHAQDHPEVYKFLYFMDLDHNLDTIDMLWASLGMMRGQKVAYFLKKMSERSSHIFGAKPMISMSQNLLAQMLGLSRLSLGQQLSDLEQRKVIRVERKRIYILDVPALQGLAMSDEAA
jgi:CRP-like cAMP-binding protein